MNHDRKLREMLDFVLRDEKLAALEGEIRRACLAELAVKRSRSRRARWLIPAAAALLFVLLRMILWMDDGLRPTVGPGPRKGEGEPAYLVSTRPLLPGLRVTTSGRDVRAHRVRTGPIEVARVATRRLPGVVVAGTADPVARLTDEEMLDLFPGVPLGLLAAGDSREKLVFLNPEDEERFVARLDD